MSDYRAKLLGESSILIKIADVDAITKAQGRGFSLAETYNDTFSDKDPDTGKRIPLSSESPREINSNFAVPLDVLDGVLEGYIPKTYNPHLAAGRALFSAFRAAETGVDPVREAKLLSELKVKDGEKIRLHVPPALNGPKQGGPLPPSKP